MPVAFLLLVEEEVGRGVGGTSPCVSQPRPLPAATADALPAVPAAFVPVVTSICVPPTLTVWPVSLFPLPSWAGLESSYRT